MTGQLFLKEELKTEADQMLLVVRKGLSLCIC